ncbi:MAG: flagellar filament capping protein FliD [Chthoniobacteraceae bacterium]
MAGVQISGLASGLNWTTIVNELVQADSAPVTNLQAKQTTLTAKNNTLTSIQTSLQTLQTSVTALNDPTLFTQRSASTSNSLWSATADPGTVAGTHTISVSQLATASTYQGASQISSPISSSNDVSGVLISGMNVAQTITAGDFTVNGARVTIATTDTLQDVFQKISTATNGAVTASYDSSTDEMTLSSSSPIVLGSANDTSNFLAVMKLGNNSSGTITSSSRLGSTNLDTALSSAALAGTLSGQDSSGNGVITINGQAISYNTGTDTLRTLISKINSSSAGVTASYDAKNDRMVLTNNVTGDLGVSVQDTTGNLASVLGLTTGTLTEGSNAKFTVDGGATRTSTSNSLTADDLGITGLSVTIASKTTENVAVGNSTSSAQTAIQNFITNFNAVQQLITDSTTSSTSGTTVTTNTLTGDLNVTSIARSLINPAFQSFGGASSTSAIQRLDSMGIDFSGTTGQLTIKDSSKLASALNNNNAAVSTFFTDSTTGLATAFSTLLNKVSGYNGSIAQEITQNNTESSHITDQITQLQRQLDAEKAQLTSEFTLMETMQTQLQNQLQSLNQMFNSGNTSTTSSNIASAFSSKNSSTSSSSSSSTSSSSSSS